MLALGGRQQPLHAVQVLALKVRVNGARLFESLGARMNHQSVVFASMVRCHSVEDTFQPFSGVLGEFGHLLCDLVFGDLLPSQAFLQVALLFLEHVVAHFFHPIPFRLDLRLARMQQRPS